MKIRLILLAVMLLSQAAPGKGPGSISGRVVDVETGLPLADVNVILEGTHIGAATDTRGFYRIDRVPEGVYSIRFSHIGYAVFIIREVRIKPEQAVTINARLVSQPYELSEIVVTAQRPMVDKSVTNTQIVKSASSITTLPPVRGVSSLTTGYGNVIRTAKETAKGDPEKLKFALLVKVARTMAEK